MKGKARIRRAAVEDLFEIANHIAQRNLSAGIRFYLAAKRQIQQIADHPRGGTKFYKTKRAELAELRFWPIRRYRTYLIFYLPTDDGIDVIRVLHGARYLPSILRKSI
jgi:toxin ParE1/3/4